MACVRPARSRGCKAVTSPLTFEQQTHALQLALLGVADVGVHVALHHLQRDAVAPIYDELAAAALQMMERNMDADVSDAEQCEL